MKGVGMAKKEAWSLIEGIGIVRSEKQIQYYYSGDGEVWLIQIFLPCSLQSKRFMLKLILLYDI
jgi:hypothetical protein